KPSPACVYVRQPSLMADVWNLEMSFNSNVLKKGFGLTSVEEVFDAIPSLWSYATKDFIYVSRPNNPKEVHPAWSELSSTLADLSVDYFRRKSRSKGDPNLEYRKDQLIKN